MGTFRLSLNGVVNYKATYRGSVLTGIGTWTRANKENEIEISLPQGLHGLGSLGEMIQLPSRIFQQNLADCIVVEEDCDAAVPDLAARPRLSKRFTMRHFSSEADDADNDADSSDGVQSDEARDGWLNDELPIWAQVSEKHQRMAGVVSEPFYARVVSEQFYAEQRRLAGETRERILRGYWTTKTCGALPEDRQLLIDVDVHLDPRTSQKPVESAETQKNVKIDFPPSLPDSRVGRVDPHVVPFFADYLKQATRSPFAQFIYAQRKADAEGPAANGATWEAPPSLPECLSSQVGRVTPRLLVDLPRATSRPDRTP